MVLRGHCLEGPVESFTCWHPCGRLLADGPQSYDLAYHAVATETVGPIVYLPPAWVAVWASQIGRLRSIPRSTTGPVYGLPQ